jgi:hypothetical protein
LSGHCGADLNQTCAGSDFGNCCSAYNNGYEKTQVIINFAKRKQAGIQATFVILAVSQRMDIVELSQSSLPLQALHQHHYQLLI